MRTLVLFATTMLALLPVATALPPAVPEYHAPDGITALIEPVETIVDVAQIDHEDALTHEIIMRDVHGDFAFDITILEDLSGQWTKVARGASLRIAVYDEQGEHDVFTKYFVGSIGQPVRVVAPGSIATTGQVMDVWITIVRGDEYPTSHLSVEKNALIKERHYALADVFDYHHGLNPIAG